MSQLAESAGATAAAAALTGRETFDADVAREDDTSHDVGQHGLWGARIVVFLLREGAIADSVLDVPRSTNHLALEQLGEEPGTAAAELDAV